MSNNDFRNNGGHKCVKTQDGEQMAQRIGAVAYVENSALTKEGVRNVSIKRNFEPGFRRTFDAHVPTLFVVVLGFVPPLMLG